MKIIQESFISKQTRALLISPTRFDNEPQKCYNLGVSSDAVYRIS